MRRIALVLAEHRYNKNSVAVLTGAVEASACAAHVDVCFSKPGAASVFACLDRASARPPGHAGGGAIPITPQTKSPRTPDMIVLGCSFATAAVPDAAATLRRARIEAAGRGWPLVTLAGGPHPSGDPAGTLAMGFDLVLCGEGEEALPLLLDRFAAETSPGDVPGLCWMEGGALHRNPRPRTVDLDTFPPFAPGAGRNAPFELSRGCPWGCRFCETTFLTGARPRHRSLERLVHWAEVARANGNRDLRFLSADSFAWGSTDGGPADPVRLDELLGESVRIFGRGHVFFGSFPSEARPEHVTPNLVEVVARHAANDCIAFGAQSGSDRILKAIHRGHDSDAVRRAARVVLAAGLRPIVDFICGLPGEDPSDREATRGLIRELADLGAVVHTHTFMPLPGTHLWAGPPGEVDDVTRELLDTLASQGRHIGRWRTHQGQARRTAAFLAALEHGGGILP